MVDDRLWMSWLCRWNSRDCPEISLNSRQQTMTSLTPEPTTASPVGHRTVRRIIYLIPAFGVAAGLLATLLHRLDWAAGLIFGAGLAWLNFWWMKRGTEAFTLAAAGKGATEKRKGQSATYLAVTLVWYFYLSTRSTVEHRDWTLCLCSGNHHGECVGNLAIDRMRG